MDCGGGAVGYNVRYRLVGAPHGLLANTTANSYSVYSLTASSNYEWQVETVCAGGTTSGFSASTIPQRHNHVIHHKTIIPLL